MTILEQILAGLQQKFAGVDTAILTRIATKKAEGVTDETKVNSIIEGISFSDVLNSYGDFRAGDASKTAVSNYEKKHNLKDGKSIENPNPNPNPNPKLEDKTDDMAAIIANAVSAAVKPLSDKLTNVNEYFFSNDKTRIAMSGDGRHIYCSCYMANVGLLRSTDFLETAEPFKPDNCYSVYSIACNGRGNLVAIVCKNINNKYDLMLSGDYGKTWWVSNGLKDSTVPLMGVEMSHSGRYIVAYASSPNYTVHELYVSSDYGETFSSEIFRGPITKIAISGDGKYMLCCCNRESSSKLYYAYYSGDYGKTWTKITDSSFSARTLAISYDGKYMVIEGGYSYSGARISADYGKTWALKHSVIGNSFALGLSSDGKYAIAQESSSPYRMFKSSDYLGSFTEINTAPLTSGIRANYRFIIMNKNRL